MTHVDDSNHGHYPVNYPADPPFPWVQETSNRSSLKIHIYIYISNMYNYAIYIYITLNDKLWTI